jgi:hypothetical protein
MSDDNNSRSRPVGRRPLGDGGPAAQVNVRLPPGTFDRVHARANAERRQVPDLMRRAVDRYLAGPPSDEDDDR